MNHKVSIITTAYNLKPFIGKCLESVVNQTYQNWEQIIVDDASDDTTYEIILKYARKDKRIKVLRHKKNWGIRSLPEIYNRALSHTSGDLIAILEGDDYWPKNKLEEQIKAFDNKRVVLSYGDSIMVNKYGWPIKLFAYISKDKRLLNNINPGSILKLFSSLDFSIIPATVIIRKSALKKIGGFRKDNFYPFTDIPTFLSLSLVGEFSYVEKILGFYRKQEASYWFKFAKKTQSMGREEIQECLKNFLEINKKNPKVKGIKHTKYAESFILKKKRLKWLSILLNQIAFTNMSALLIPPFLIEYLSYRLLKWYYPAKPRGLK